MANTLTDLTGTIYAAAHKVDQQLMGAVPAVRLNLDETERAALGQTITYPIAPEQTSVTYAPGAAPPVAAGQVIGKGNMIIDNAETVNIGWTGQEIKKLSNNFGSDTYSVILRDQLANAITHILGLVEAGISAKYPQMSRAYGVAGTTPFGTAGDLSDASNMRRILNANGAAQMERSLILNGDAAANVTSHFWKANEMGETSALTSGILTRKANLDIRETNYGAEHTAGTASGATTDATGYAVGATTLTLAVAGTGSILVGDVISFTGDSERYVVTAGDADVSGGGTISIQEPGLRVAIPASATAITLAANYDVNMAFQKDAIVLLARNIDYGDDEGELAVDTMSVPNQLNLPLEIRQYAGYGQTQYILGMAWGISVVNPKHTAILLG